MTTDLSEAQIPKLSVEDIPSLLPPPYPLRPPMAHPTNHLRILAPPDPQPSSPDSPPLKPRAAAMATQPAAAKLDSSAMAAKSSHLSNYIPFSRLHSQTVVSSQRRTKNSNPPPAIKDSHLQAKALTVSAMVDSSRFHVVKSKPQPKKIASACNEKTRKSCKELDRKKLVDEKKEANEEVDDSKALVLVVKDKEMKELQKGHRLDSLRPAVSLFRKGGRRRSFGGSQVELADIFANNGVKVVSVDMPPVLQIHAVDCARKVHDSMEKFTSKTLALSLKREFDGVYGPAWHCIVGTSFGSFVTHSVGGFLYFSMDQKLYILLFKTTVQRAG